ncbi:hypothetical protein [Streptomyces sp. NPDC101249]|uniref:hypothetical protein n=1 Tax=Streptomyces sp. NPDC101249 TaxID=3366140 RepID=UPI0037F47E5E
MNATATKPAVIRTYATAEKGMVALGMTDGEFYWLADLNGNRISEFGGNRAHCTIFARRAFGRLA